VTISASSHKTGNLAAATGTYPHTVHSPAGSESTGPKVLPNPTPPSPKQQVKRKKGPSLYSAMDFAGIRLAE